MKTRRTKKGEEEVEFLTEMGERLRKMRKALGETQKVLAQKTRVSPISINRLELGTGGTAYVLAKVLNYYSQFFVIDYLFAENFALVEMTGESREGVKSEINSVIIKMMSNIVDNQKKGFLEMGEKLEEDMNRIKEFLE